MNNFQIQAVLSADSIREIADILKWSEPCITAALDFTECEHCFDYTPDSQSWLWSVNPDRPVTNEMSGDHIEGPLAKDSARAIWKVFLKQLHNNYQGATS